MSTKTLTYTQEIAAPTAQVYRAFTNAQALQEWFADVAETETRAGGRFYVWWNQDYYTAGQYQTLKENQEVVFSWHGLGEPAPTRVRVQFEANGDGDNLARTKVTLYHEDVPEEGVHGFDKEWPNALLNLKSVLETGVDKRLYDRPMLGFFIGGLVDENLKKRLGIPVDTGVHVSGVLDGMGAEKSGVKADDVIFSIGGKEVTTFPSIGQILSQYKGGDVVETIIYRGADQVVLPVELSKRPIPEFPSEPAELARIGHEAYSEVLTKLDEILADVTEEEACHNPSPGAWNLKQILAHLIINERYSQFSWALLSEGNKDPQFPAQSLVSAIAQTYSWQALRDELRNSVKVHLNQIPTLPQEYVANKGSYFRAGNDFARGIRDHYAEHTAQIKTVLESARKAESVPA